MKHIVMFSGGAGSWAAAKRLSESVPVEDMILLFADTMIEDADLYRFVEDAAKNIGAELVRIADGRTIWQVFKDVGFMGNSRVDPCSRILKRELCDKWISERFAPEECRIYVGIDYTEVHRLDRMAERKKPYVYDAPLINAPYLDKAKILEWAQREGLALPKLYRMGFPHNNCGGFCVKAGQAQFRKLWQEKPDYYRECEQAEEQVYQEIGSRHPFIRISQGNEYRYLTMREFREEFLEGSRQCDLFDWGGCGCFFEE